MILRARVVVTMDGPPIADGAVAISGDRVVDIGRFGKIKVQHSGEIVDLGERALLPGLINSHCHLDYSCLRGKILRPKSFSEWIRAINAERAELSEADYLESIQAGFTEAKKFGTTTIANLTGVPQLISQLEPPIRAWWFAELIDVRQPGRANQIVDLAVESLGRAQPLGAPLQWGLAPHALYTASADLFRRCEEIARRDEVLLTTHLAESREEMEMFRDASGALYEFLKEIGRSMSDCGGRTPIEVFLGRGGSPNRSEPDWHLRAIGVNRSYLLVHANELETGDFDLLNESASNISIVHCPRSHAYFGHARFQFERLRDVGCNICLGTDSLASNSDLSLFAEMRQFRNMFPSVSREEILRMVTVNAARALRQESHLGKICARAQADFVAVPIGHGDLFEEIIAFEGEPWVMVGGAMAQAEQGERNG
ncbi:MAG TPA: amidohydrolase family protein [Chthoniobacterales bacterium]